MTSGRVDLSPLHQVSSESGKLRERKSLSSWWKSPACCGAPLDACGAIHARCGPCMDRTCGLLIKTSGSSQDGGESKELRCGHVVSHGTSDGARHSWTRIGRKSNRSGDHLTADRGVRDRDVEGVSEESVQRKRSKSVFRDSAATGRMGSAMVLAPNRGCEDRGGVTRDAVVSVALIDRPVRHRHLVAVRGNVCGMRDDQCLRRSGSDRRADSGCAPEQGGAGRRNRPSGRRLSVIAHGRLAAFRAASGLARRKNRRCGILLQSRRRHAGPGQRPTKDGDAARARPGWNLSACPSSGHVKRRSNANEEH